MNRSRAAEAQKHLAALERLERIIAAFASMVSHQTRTALVGIQGLSELIRDGDLDDEEVRAFAGDIFQEALKIDAMIGEMFDLSRLETRQAPFRRVKVDLHAVIQEAASNLRLPAGLDLGADPATVPGDRDRLHQALQKLFGFMVRTALPESFIKVVTCRREDAIEVSIRSSSSKVVEFEDWFYGRYERYEQRPSEIFGVGFGLAIARAIIELHDGKIEARTGPEGGGAEFRLTLPSPAVSAEAPAREPESTPSR